MLKRMLPLALVCLHAANGHAQESGFGAQVTLNLPQGDLAKKEFLDHRPGVGVGIHWFFDLGSGHALRPRADYILYGSNTHEETDQGYLFRVETKLKTFSFGLDYLWFVEGRPMGFFLVAGLNQNSQKFDISASASGNPVGTGSFRETWNKLGYAAGAGYQFNRNFGAELRYTATKFGSNNLSNNNLQAGATWRF